MTSLALLVQRSFQSKHWADMFWLKNFLTSFLSADVPMIPKKFKDCLHYLFFVTLWVLPSSRSRWRWACRCGALGRCPGSICGCQGTCRRGSRPMVCQKSCTQGTLSFGWGIGQASGWGCPCCPWPHAHNSTPHRCPTGTSGSSPRHW